MRPQLTPFRRQNGGGGRNRLLFLFQVDWGPFGQEGGGYGPDSRGGHIACFPREKASLSAVPFRASVALMRSSADQIADAQAPFWRHVREALAERHP